GLEFRHGSDLDLVFIHGGAPHAEANCAKQIDGAQFFTRLGQRIIPPLTTHTASVSPYAEEMRLRPPWASRRAFRLLGAFQRYQQSEAWTWEHQALVRARVLVGCARLAEQFGQVRAEVLGAQRDMAALRSGVSEMRAKMRDNLGNKSTAAGMAANAF